LAVFRTRKPVINQYMKASNFIVSIPEPCHEDWNKMQPDEKGRFCNSCSKSVHDFSGKTDAEIKDILLAHKDQKICGHFKKSQVNRPLNITINFKELPKNISTTKAFAIALFLVFGTLLFSCTDHKGRKIEAIEMINQKPEQIMVGMIAMPPPTDMVDGEVEMVPDSLVTQNVCEISTLGGAVAYEEVFVESEEIHMKGDVSIEEREEETTPIVAVKDSAIVQSPDSIMYDRRILGQLYVIIPGDNNQVDSSSAVNATGIGNESDITKESEFIIYPNPGKGEFTLKYDVLKRSDVRADVYDMKGTWIQNLVNVPAQHEGKYQVGVNLDLPDGIYIVNLINNGKRSSKKLVIAR